MSFVIGYSSQGAAYGTTLPLSALSGALKIADKVNGHYGCGGDKFA